MLFIATYFALGVKAVVDVVTAIQLAHEQIAQAVAAIVGAAGAAPLGSLLTKLHASQAIKGVVTTALALLTGCLTTVAWAPHAPWTQWAIAVLYAWGAQVAAHYTGWTNPIAAATRNLGLGTNRGADGLGPDPRL
jgi:hypothetical protein